MWIFIFIHPNQEKHNQHGYNRNTHTRSRSHNPVRWKPHYWPHNRTEPAREGNPKRRAKPSRLRLRLSTNICPQDLAWLCRSFACVRVRLAKSTPALAPSTTAMPGDDDDDYNKTQSCLTSARQEPAPTGAERSKRQRGGGQRVSPDNKRGNKGKSIRISRSTPRPNRTTGSDDGRS